MKIEKECRITDISVIFFSETANGEKTYREVEIGLDHRTKIRLSKERYKELGAPQLWETLVFTLAKTANSEVN